MRHEMKKILVVIILLSAYFFTHASTDVLSRIPDDDLFEPPPSSIKGFENTTRNSLRKQYQNLNSIWLISSQVEPDNSKEEWSLSRRL
jgi:hypothetical protein